jgi:hypothetical protein
MMKQKKLVEAFVVADVSDGISYWIIKTPEQEAKAMESLCSEFNDFVRDHRSMDWVTLKVQRVYQDQCSHCHLEWEVDDEGVPMCCRAAIEEHALNLCEEAELASKECEK